MGLFDDLQKTPELPEENEILQPRGESLETPDVAPETTEEAILIANDTRKNIEQEEGMEFGNPVDFAEQFNNTVIAAAGAPVDLMTWALNGASKILGGPELIDPETVAGGSKQLKGMFGTVGIGSEDQADTYLGYAGNTFGEAVAFMGGGAAVVQKTKQAGGVIGSLSRQADDALRTKLDTVVATEVVAAGGMAAGRQYAEENEMGATGSLLLEFTTGAMAMVSAAAAKKAILDPLTAKLKNMTATEALEKLSKEEVAEVVARGREEKAKVEPEAEAPKETPEAPAEPTPAPKTDAGDVLELSDGFILEKSDTPFADRDTWVFKKDGENVGYLNIGTELSDNRQAPRIIDVKVKDGARGKGLARQSIQKLVQKYGVISSDNSGKTSDDAVKMWESIGGRTPTADDPNVDKAKFILRKEDIQNSADTPEAPAEPTPAPKTRTEDGNDFAPDVEDTITRAGFNPDTFWRRPAYAQKAIDDMKSDIESINNPQDKLSIAFEKAIKAIEETKAPAKPKDAPSEPTTTPKTPEVAPEAAPTSASGDAIDESIAAVKGILEGDRTGGKGARVTREAKRHFRAVSKEFFDDIGVLLKTKDVEVAKKILSRIDKYIEFDRIISKKDYAQGSELQANTRQAMDNGTTDYAAGISAAGNERTENLNVLKGMLQKIVGEGVEGGDDLNRILDDIIKEPDTPEFVKPDAKKPKEPKDGTTPKKPVDRLKAQKKNLQKKLDELRQRFGDDVKLDEANAKAAAKTPKPKNPEIKALEERIKFYEAAEKEVATLEDLKKQLARLAEIEGSGDLTLQRKATAKKPNLSDTPSKVAEVRAKIAQTKARMRQRLKEIDAAAANKLSKEEKLDAVADQVAKTFVEQRAGVFQQAIDGYFTVRLTQMLNQAKTAFVGVPSATFMSVVRPLINTPYNIAKAAGMKGQTVSRRVQYAAADVTATYEYARMLTKHLKDTLRSAKDTILNKGDSNFLYRDRNAYIRDELAEASEPTHAVKRRMKQAQRRVAAKEAKTELGRKVLNAKATVLNSKLAQVPAFFIDYGVSLIGGLEEMSLIAHSMRAARAQGIKKGIDDGVDDVWKFSEDYMESAFDRSRGGIQAKYDPEYAEIFNQARRDHFRAMDLDPKDIRRDMVDGLIGALNKVSTNHDEMGYLARILFVFIGVPMRAGAGNLSYMLSPANVAKNVAGGGTRRLEQALGGTATFGKYNKRISELEIEIKGQKKLLKSEDPDVKTTAEKKLAELEDSLATTKDLKMQKDYEDLGKLAIGSGLFFLGYEMAKNGQVAGTDSWMTDEQKLAAQKVQGAPNSWKIVLGGNEFDFKYFEPLKGVFALGADYARRQAAEEAGALTDDQTFTQFITSVTKSIATDSPFATGARYMTQIMSPNPETQERGVLGVVRSLVPVPAEVRNFNKFDEEFGTDTTSGEFFDTVLSASLGQETGNYRLTSLGEPKLKEEPSLVSYLIPFGPKAVPEREPIDDILLEDAMSFRSVSAPQTSISGFKLKNFTNEDNETLYSLYGRLITETRINGKTQRQALNALVKTRDFKNAYNNNKYTMDDKGTEINEGIEMIKDVIAEYRAEARFKILETKAAADYLDGDGNNIYDILKEREQFNEQPESLLETLSLD